MTFGLFVVIILICKVCIIIVFIVRWQPIFLVVLRLLSVACVAC